MRMSHLLCFHDLAKFPIIILKYNLQVKVPLFFKMAGQLVFVILVSA